MVVSEEVWLYCTMLAGDIAEKYIIRTHTQYTAATYKTAFSKVALAKTDSFNETKQVLIQ